VASNYLFTGGVRPSGLVIRSGMDRLGPWQTRSSMENPAFVGLSLSNAIVIMVIMCVLMVELPCHAVKRQIPVLECLFARCAWAPVVRSCLL
jgi:hypothetical protein